MTPTRCRVSWPQRKLLTAREIYPGDPSNNLVQLWRVDGRLDADRAAYAFETCFDQMPAAKIHIAVEEDRYVQVLDPSRRVRCRRETFAAGEDDLVAARAQAVAGEWACDPIDVGTWPLVRATLFCTDSDVRYVLLAMPHVICDAYSAYTLFRAIADQYNNLDGSTQQPEPFELFGDYISAIETDAPDVVANPEAVEYFRQQLRDVSTLTHASISRPRDAQGRLRGRLLVVNVTGAQAAQIRAGLKATRVFEHAFFFAAYCVFLNRLTREQRLVAGLHVATRDSLKEVGYHVNTLPVSVDLPDDKPFLELCRQIQALTYEVLRFRKFDYFHRDAKPLKGTINNAFTFQKTPINIPFEGSHLTPVPLDPGFVPFDFGLAVENLAVGEDGPGDASERGYRCKFYLSTWFDSMKVEELFPHVVAQLADRPQLPVGEVALASEEALRRLYRQLNRYRPVAEPRPVHTLFAEVAAAWPERTALTFGSQAVSYAELDKQSDRVAAVLMDRHPGLSNAVVWMARGITPITCILGILKAGKAYVPIDPYTPVARLQLVLDELGDAVVICDDARASTLSDQTMTVMTTGELDALAPTVGPFPAPRVDVDSSASVMYTSGSTGVPKGVTITHRNLVNFLTRLQEEYRHVPSDVFAQCSSMAFDMSVWEIFGCLLSGGRLVLLSYEQARTPQALYRVVQDERVTALVLTPTAFSGLQREDDLRREPLCLRYVVVGGEPLQASQLTSWLERHPLAEVPIYNGYGITETSVCSMSHRLTPDDIMQSGLGVVGRPWAHAGVHIVDSELQPLPRGVPGELVIHGDSVSPGYFKRDDLTAERFVKKELLGEPLLVYRSGDLMRVTRDLELEFMGRMDQQVQLHGFRVELGEIAAAFAPLVSPAACHLCMVQRSAGLDQLAAFIVGDRTREELAELRMSIKRTLPAYMVPGYIVAVPALPLTVNGKIDESALLGLLPRMDTRRAGDAVGPTEKYIQSLIASAIHHNDFSRDDNFFDVGLNSVHVADVYQRLVRQFPGTPLRMTDLFLYTTLASLGEYIDRLVAVEAEPSRPNGVPDEASAGHSQGVARRRTFLESRGRRS